MTLPRTQAQPAAADISLISELYEAIAASPPAIEERKLQVQLLMNCEWLDAARDAVSELLVLVPTDEDAQVWRVALGEAPAKNGPGVVRLPPKSSPLTAGIEGEKESRSELEKGRKTIFGRVRSLHWEPTFIHKIIQQKPKSDASDVLIGEHADPERKARSKPSEVASQMKRDPAKAVDVAFEDLKDTAQWLLSIANQPLEEADKDDIREALQKRTQGLMSALPLELQQATSTAQIHVEHEVLHRTYICSETMYGDPVSEIPREKFLVTEDGYPWDMEELAQAIASNGGVMRNPLSRQLFTPKDVKAIVRHPLGKSLAALQMNQRELSKGVRSRTVEEMAKLSRVMLGDDSSDQMESRHALDEFLAYMATLPEAEQKALDKLRVPAKDSHTGQAYDSSIGDAVRDAQANRVCIHKIGDFLSQAAKYLGQKG